MKNNPNSIIINLQIKSENFLFTKLGHFNTFV